MSDTRPAAPPGPTSHRAILFDFEGTLVDFQWKLLEGEAALRTAFEALGLPADELSSQTYATMWNQAVDSGLDEGELKSRAAPIYDRYDLDALARWRLRAGVQELLVALRARDIRLGIVSNIGHRALDAAMERFGLQPLFDRVLARDDVRRMKPDPEGILRCLGDWGLTTGEVLFVGDSRTDIRSARAAGVAVAIIMGGESSAGELAALPPDHLLEGFEDLRRLLSV